MRPEDIQPVGDQEVLVVWEDGHRSLYRFDDLRFLCPCAGCLDEMTGKRTVEREKIHQGIKALEYLPVGNYAVRFKWSDGHHTGIYSFDYLRKLCACPKCKSIMKTMTKSQ